MRNLSAALTVILVGMVLSVSLWSAKADQPNSENSNDDESVEVRFARAHLELAKLDLRRATEFNKRTPNLLSDAFIEKLKLHVVIDEQQLEQCLRQEDADAHQICIRSAEAAVEIAEANGKRKRAIHRRMPTTSSALDVERAEAVAEIAKLHLERTRAVEDDSSSILTHLQWQIDELRHQVLELQMRLGAGS